MRKFTNEVGTDTTAAVKAYLLATRTPIIADCIVITNILGWTLRFTNFTGPLTLYGNVYSNSIKYKRGSITSKIGFEVSTLAMDLLLADSDLVTWPSVSPSTSATYALRDSFRDGFWDYAQFLMYRVVLPQPDGVTIFPGKTATYGACPWFSGRMGKAVVGSDMVSLTVNSGLEILNRPLPPFTIESDNRLAEVFAGVNPKMDVSKRYTGTVQANSTTQKLIIATTGDYAGDVLDDGSIDDGCVYFNPALSAPGPLVNLFCAIQHNVGSGGNNVIFLIKPLPIIPPTTTTVELLRSVPRDRATAQTIINGGVTDNGFGDVPQPELAV